MLRTSPIFNPFPSRRPLPSGLKNNSLGFLWLLQGLLASTAYCSFISPGWPGLGLWEG